MDKHIIQTYLETIIGDSAADAELLSYYVNCGKPACLAVTGLSLGQVTTGIFEEFAEDFDAITVRDVKEGLRRMAVGRMLYSAAIGYVDVVYFPGVQFVTSGE